MNKYLLLRDNKQTGPYTLEDIRALGLKSYDLIWIENKSAAWRYAGEIEEFKSFAPEVEEQPFDRFFKKSSTETKKASGNTDLPVIEEKQRIKVSEDKPRIISNEEMQKTNASEEKLKYAPLHASSNSGEQQHNGGQQNQGSTAGKETRRPKYVAVSMPSGIQKVNTPIAKDGAKENTEVLKKAESVEKSIPVALDITVKPTQEITTQSRNVSADTMPVQATISKKSSFSFTGIVQVFAVAVGLVSLVALGVLIGMKIGTSKKQDSVPVDPGQAKEINTTGSEGLPANLNTVPPLTIPADSLQQLNAAKQKEISKPVNRKSTSIIPTAQVESPVKEETVKTSPEDAKPPVDEAKEKARQNMVKSIAVYTNDYKVGLFGGIDDVKITVNNNSEYPVDLVVVDVQYMQSNKKAYKTESIRFKDIAANSSLTMEAPKTNRGIRIQTKLTYISSKALDLSENIW